MIVPILMPISLSGSFDVKVAVSIIIAFNLIGIIVMLVRIPFFIYKKRKNKDFDYSFVKYVIFDSDLNYKISFINGAMLIIINGLSLLIFIIIQLMSIIQKFI